MIRFLLDEHVPHAVAHGLRQRGVEVSTAAEANLLSIDDSLILEFALNEGYVIFTQDADFLRLHQAGKEHHGIIYSTQGKRSLGEIVRYLKLIADVLEADEITGSVEYL